MWPFPPEGPQQTSNFKKKKRGPLQEITQEEKYQQKGAWTFLTATRKPR